MRLTRLAPRALCLLLLLFAPASLPARAQAPADAPTVADITLPSGMRVYCRRETSTPLVAVDVFVRAGAGDESGAQAGLGNLVAHTVLGSTSNLSADGMARDIGALGGNVGAAWQPDWTQIGALTVKDKLSDCLFLLADAVQNADFDPNVLADARASLLTEIGAADASVYQTATANIRRILYAGTPYGRPPAGAAASVARLTREDLARYFNRFYVPANLTWVIVGDIDPAAAQAQVISDLSGFPTKGRGDGLGAGARPAPADPLPLPQKDFAPVHLAQPDLSEVCVMLGCRVPGVADKDYPAVLVANALLGGMKTSRLFTQLREKQGLGYQVGSVVNGQQAGGDLTAFVFAAPTRTDPATRRTVAVTGVIKDAMLAQFAALRAAPPPLSDVVRARHFLAGAEKLRHERLEDRAALLGAALLTHPGSAHPEADFLRALAAVTPADVQRVAQAYFVHPAVVVVEPASGSTVSE